MILTYLLGFILSWSSCEVASGIICSEWKGKKKRYWKFYGKGKGLIICCKK